MTDSFELKFGSDEESIGAIVALQRGLILTEVDPIVRTTGLRS